MDIAVGKEDDDPRQRKIEAGKEALDVAKTAKYPGTPALGIELILQPVHVETFSGRDLFLLKDILDDDRVGGGQAGRQLLLEEISPQAPGARFKNDHDLVLGVKAGQPGQHAGNGRGMMGEILDENGVLPVADDRQPALHPPETGQRLFDRRQRQPQFQSQDDAGGQVPNVVGAGQRRVKFPAAGMALQAEIVSAAPGPDPGDFEIGRIYLGRERTAVLSIA